MPDPLPVYFNPLIFLYTPLKFKYLTLPQSVSSHFITEQRNLDEKSNLNADFAAETINFIFIIHPLMYNTANSVAL